MKAFMLSLLLFLSAFCAEVENTSNNDFSDFSTEFNKAEVFDPLSGYNRFMTGFNNSLYYAFFRPVFKGYNAVVPEPAKKGVSNFFYNLFFPIRFVGNILQFRFMDATDELFSFAINTTFGVAGLFEVANTYFDIPRHDEDIAQAFGHWGIGSGFPIVLPIIGQSNLRDSVGLAAEFFINPISYADGWAGGHAWKNSFIAPGMSAGYILNEGGTNPDEYRILTKDAIDLYPFLRDTYEQRRNAQIKE